jgi:hypothetical protein
MDFMKYGTSPWLNLKLASIAKDVHFDNERSQHVGHFFT